MLSDLFYRIRALFYRRQMDADVEEELRNHLEREAEKYRLAGVVPNGSDASCASGAGRQ